MIKKESGYYYSVDQPHPQPQPQQQPLKQRTKVPLQIIGNIKQYIQHVATEVTRIKQLKRKQKQQEMSKKLVLDSLMGGANGSGNGDGQWEKCQVKVDIRVPEEIYMLEQRIAKLEGKIVNDEIVRQKVQRKGKLSQRAKLLAIQIQKLSQKSPQTISANIQSYFKSLQQRQQQNKALFLYEAFTKTTALTEQIQMLDIYLANLNSIMMKFKALPPLKIVVENHEKILERRKKNSERVEKMYQWMVGEYEKVVKEIDSI